MANAARAAISRGAAGWFEMPAYCSSAPLRSPRTISLWMAVCSCISIATFRGSAAERATTAATNIHSLRGQCVVAVRSVSRLRKILAIESVTQAAQVAEVARARRIRLNLLAKIGNVVVDDAVAGEGIRAPGAGEQAVAAEDTAARADKQGQQLEFDGRQLDGSARAAQFTSLEINLDITEAVTLRLWVARGATQ